MNTRHFALRLALVALTAGLFVGCASTRAVTSHHWVDGDHYVVAYTEMPSNSSHVTVCKRQETNELVCKAQPEVDQVLAK